MDLRETLFLRGFGVRLKYSSGTFVRHCPQGQFFVKGNKMMLKDNPEIELPSFKGGSFGGMDQHLLPDNLVLRAARKIENTNVLEITAQDKGGPEIRKGKVELVKGSPVRIKILYQWLGKHIGETIDKIYRSQFDFDEYLIDLGRQADEGIQWLLDRPQLKEKIKYYDELESIQKSIKEFILTKNIKVLEMPLKLFRKTTMAVPEGADAFETTIWNSQVRIRSEAQYLEHIFNDLEEIYILTN